MIRIRHCNTPSLLHWALQKFPKSLGSAQNNLLLGSKYLFFWSKFLSMYSFTFDSILLRLLRIPFFISSDKSLSNKVATIVFSVKNFPKWHLRQNLECECNWYVVHCVKSVQIRSYFWSVFSCIHTEYRDLLRILFFSMIHFVKQTFPLLFQRQKYFLF